MGAKELVRMQQEDKKENADVGPGKGWKRGKCQPKLSHCKGQRDWMRNSRLTIFIAFNSAISTSLLCDGSGAVNDAFGDSFLLVAWKKAPLSGFRGEDAVSVAWNDSAIATVGCSGLCGAGFLVT